MASVGPARGVQDENSGEAMLASPSGKMSRKRKMEERDENSLGEPDDFEWENSKENILPLKRGRVVNDLNRALRAHESFQGKIRVDQEAKEMEARVRDYEGPDPLSVWVQYIRWLEANMPEDTRKKFTALEKCTRGLKSHDEYKNDIRYIRLWIQYADLVSNPKDIFKFLYVNKIGEYIALFYVGWAMVLESMGNYAQAHKVYLKATQKKAHPEDLLERKYKEFQRRMSRHWLKVRPSEGSNASADEGQRFALEDISTDGADIQRLGNSDNFRRYAQAQAEKMQRANAHKPVFTVYEDVAGTEVDSLAGTADWKRLDTMQQQNKENDTAPTRWNEAPLRPLSSDAHPTVASTHARPSAEALKVFVDPEFTATAPSVHTSVDRDRSLTLRQRLDGATTEEEKLLKQPLRNFTSEAHVDDSKPPRAVKPTKKIAERCVFNEDMLKSASGEELSFEEVRARRFAVNTSKARAAHAAVPRNRFLAEAPRAAAPKPVPARETRAEASHSAGAGLQSRVPVGRGDPARPATETSVLDRAAQEDMTINTRLAMEDVNSMFCSPSRESKETVANATVWEVPEPVERKLHFSIFDDSVDSIAVNPDDISLRHENAEQVEKIAFQVFTEDIPAPQPKQAFEVFSDDTATQPMAAPRTASKMSARKPLTSREDLARRSRLTNKDMIMKMQTDDSSAHGNESAKAKGNVAHRCDNATTPMTRVNDGTRLPTTHVVSLPRQVVPAHPASPMSVDPYDPAIRKEMIESANVKAFAMSSTRLVHWHRCKIPPLWTTNHQRRKLKKPIFFHLDDKVAVEAVGFLGSGAFAQVFSVKVEGVDPTTKAMALKCEKVSRNLLWEMYITEKLGTRANFCLGTAALIPRMCRLDIFKNGALLLMDKAPAGTLHDLLNAYKRVRKVFPETLAVHYAIQMLYVVEALHEANVIHGDIKPDNWLVVPARMKLTSLQTIGKTGEVSSSTGNLRLVDFGRSIDLDHFPLGTTFRGDCHVKGFQTVEMMTKKPWTRQIDTFGVCATVHCMLFGDYMEVSKIRNPEGSLHWKPAQAFKRYWQLEMWKSFFDTFLNVPNCDHQPSLAPVRRHLERFFDESPHRQEELRELLASQDRMFSKSRV